MAKRSKLDSVRYFPTETVVIDGQEFAPRRGDGPDLGAPVIAAAGETMGWDPEDARGWLKNKRADNLETLIALEYLSLDGERTKRVVTLDAVYGAPIEYFTGWCHLRGARRVWKPASVGRYGVIANRGETVLQAEPAFSDWLEQRLAAGEI